MDKFVLALTLLAWLVQVDTRGGIFEQTTLHNAFERLLDQNADMRSKLAEMMVAASSIPDVNVCRDFLLSNNV